MVCTSLSSEHKQHVRFPQCVARNILQLRRKRTESEVINSRQRLIAESSIRLPIIAPFQWPLQELFLPTTNTPLMHKTDASSTNSVISSTTWLLCRRHANLTTATLCRCFDVIRHPYNHNHRNVLLSLARKSLSCFASSPKAKKGRIRGFCLDTAQLHTGCFPRTCSWRSRVCLQPKLLDKRSSNCRCSIVSSVDLPLVSGVPVGMHEMQPP